MGQSRFIIAVGLSVIFCMAFLNFAINFATEQSAPMSIANDSGIANLKVTSNNEAVSFSNTVNDSSVSFAQSSIDETSQSGTLVTGSIFKTLGPISALTSVFSLAYTKIFGGDSGFDNLLYLIMGIVLLVGILVMWKTWKGGNPD